MIREYHTDDLPELLDAWYAAARLAHPFWPSDRFERERAEIASRFIPTAETWVFEEQGRVVGFIALLGNEVGGLFVSPERQRHGIGRALMDHARASRDQLELDVFEANEIGRAFYDAYGFDIVGARLEEETGLRVLRLRLRTGSS